MKKSFLILSTALAFFSAAVIVSCKKTPDVPADASTYDPKLAVTGTIMQLKNIHGSSPSTVQITDDITISGIVTADDRGGNFYKQIMIQDSTSGIALLMERSGLYNDYPVGRKVYVKCKGLYLSAYGGFKQLGYTIDQTNSLVGIPSAMFNSIVVKATYPMPLPIKSVSVFDIKNNLTNQNMIGTIIKIDSGAEFTDAQLNYTYAQPASIASGTDRLIEQCGNAATIIMRNSGYAKFAGEPIPKGRGALTAIFGIYNGKAQLLIRDLNDVQFTDSVRCNGVVVPPPTPGTPITIADLRNFYTGTSVKLGNYQIHGVITSSISDSNIASSNYFMQDESGRGINIYCSGQNLSLGDSVTVNINNDSLIVYRGNLEIKNGTAGNVLVFTKVASGKNVAPKTISIQALSADLSNPSHKDRMYECTLVKIASPTIVSTTGKFYGGVSGNTMTDATGSMVQYCRNAAPYNVTNLPASITSIVGIAANFNTTQQVLIRKLTDVQ
jgi:hypothetical protein